MVRNEIAFLKQALLATRDWDTYQAILHRGLARKTLSPAPQVAKKR